MIAFTFLLADYTCNDCSVPCTAHKISATNACVNYDLQTQDEVYRQYRALAELVTLLLFVADFRSSCHLVKKMLNVCLRGLSLITPPGSGVEYCIQSVCVSAHKHISGTTQLIFTNPFVADFRSSCHLVNKLLNVCLRGLSLITPPQ